LDTGCGPGVDPGGGTDPQQVHEQGGHDWPLTQAGHAHPHPLDPDPDPLLIC
jgi:hypothetical protein